MRPISRRGVLSGLTLGVALGVTGISLSACSSEKTVVKTAVDQGSLDQVFAAEASLLALATSSGLTRVSKIHQAHLNALTAAGAQPPTPDAAGALKQLARGQRRQADLCSSLALSASPRVAQLLASIAASNAALAALASSSA